MQTKATLMNGEEVDLDKLRNYLGWIGEEDEITILGNKGVPITKIKVHTLIDVWIEKEREDFINATNCE